VRKKKFKGFRYRWTQSQCQRRTRGWRGKGSRVQELVNLISRTIGGVVEGINRVKEGGSQSGGEAVTTGEKKILETTIRKQ